MKRRSTFKPAAARIAVLAACLSILFSRPAAGADAAKADGQVGEIRIEGNRRIADTVIRRELDIKTGDPFDSTAFFDAHRRLYRTGYFDTLDFQYSSGTAKTTDVLIRVSERPTRFVKGSVGYGTEAKERLSLGWEDINFLGNARRLDVSAIYSGFVTDPSRFRTAILQARLTQPYLWDTRFQGETQVSREWNDRDAYDSVTSAWRSSVGKEFTRDINAHLRYRFQGTRVTRLSPGVSAPEFTRISAIGPTFTYDNTDDPFLPRQGWRITGATEHGFRFILGDVQFYRLEARTGRFDTRRGWTLFEGIQTGLLRPGTRGPQDEIPIFERFFIGGANTVRGYPERTLGPRDAANDPIGGNFYLVGNLELRRVLYKKLWGVLFLDGGNLYPTPPGALWPDVQLEKFGDLRYGTGTGVRYNSPVGALRLEFGYPLNPQDPVRGFWRRLTLHLSIGEHF